MHSTILLQSGKYFDFADMDTQQLSIEDIAHGLSYTCRFGGQCDKFYSVGEHSYWMSFKVPFKYALCALLHDASEAVLTDVPKPFKIMLPDYGKYELQLEKTIAKQYNIPFPYPPEIKESDKRMLITERNQLFTNYKNKDKWIWDDIKPFEDIEIRSFKPEVMKDMFLKRYEELK